MVKGKISGVQSALREFGLPARLVAGLLAAVYRLRKIFPLGAAAFATLVFLSGYEIATSTGVRESSHSLYSDQTAAQVGYVEEALTESAESNRAEIFGASMVPGFSGRLPQFIVAHACLVAETHQNYQNLITHSANPRAPPAS